MAHQPQVIENPGDMAAYRDEARAAGQRIGFVPTMGALHQGHISLMDYARSACDHLVVSIFVNPLQFDRSEDLEAYPRTWQEDLDHCARHQVDLVYAPQGQAMYPQGFQTKVSLGPITQGLCGAFRPGHFDGVATVVLKLFNTVGPDLAVFGRKDFQQLRVIQRMVADLDLPVEVQGRPTVREPDGLAMSSRNKHLTPQQRQEALCLHRALGAALALVQGGQKDAAVLKQAAQQEVEAVPQARLEYLEVVDSHSLEPLNHINGSAVMALAVWLGQTRLIDNMALN